MKLLICLWWFFASLLAKFIYCEPQLAFIGGSHTFEAKHQGEISEIILKKGKDKVAEWDSSSNVEQYYPPFENRMSLDVANGTVTASKLEKNDSGTYTLEWMDTKGTEKSITVLIVAEFHLGLEMNCNSTDSAKIRCTTDSHLPVNCTCTIGSETLSGQGSEVAISKNLPPSTVLTCFSDLSGQRKSTQISLDPCLQAEEGALSPNLIALCVVIPILGMVMGVLICLYKRGYRPSCVKGSEKLNSDGGSIALKGKPQSTADCGVSNGDTLEQKSSLLDKCGGDGGVNGGMTQGGEGVNGTCLKNSDPC